MVGKDFAIIIPAYQPDSHLIHLINRLNDRELRPIIVVNDGSDGKSLEIFQELFDYENVHLLHHSENKGKGQALKTAFTYILETNMPITGVVTADSDGQHSEEDIIKVGGTLIVQEPSFVLGVRNFDQENVPSRSRIGNKLTSYFFNYFFDYYFQDTQTGLRGIHHRELEWLVDLPGDRFEYEINMLIAMTLKELSFVEVEIETRYEDDHQSHYATFKDSIRIGRSVLKGYFRYK